ncbi:hypothetical protein BaRGS_00004642, partial [Batillaria attramentaria]
DWNSDPFALAVTEEASPTTKHFCPLSVPSDGMLEVHQTIVDILSQHRRYRLVFPAQ